MAPGDPVVAAGAAHRMLADGGSLQRLPRSRIFKSIRAALSRLGADQRGETPRIPGETAASRMTSMLPTRDSGLAEVQGLDGAADRRRITEEDDRPHCARAAGRRRAPWLMSRIAHEGRELVSANGTMEPSVIDALTSPKKVPPGLAGSPSGHQPRDAAVIPRRRGRASASAYRSSHDLSEALAEHGARLPEDVRPSLTRWSAISKDLRKEPDSGCAGGEQAAEPGGPSAGGDEFPAVGSTASREPPGLRTPSRGSEHSAMTAAVAPTRPSISDADHAHLGFDLSAVANVTGNRSGNRTTPSRSASAGEMSELGRAGVDHDGHFFLAGRRRA